MGTILIVEDDADILSLLTELFEEEGWRVRCCSSGAEVPVALVAGLPDLMLLDLLLPGRRGVEVVQDLRRNPATAALPVIVMTASTMARADVPFADALVRKPFRARELLRLAESLAVRPGNADQP